MLSKAFETIMSGRPLPRSATLTEDGSSPTAYGFCVWNVPSPLPINTLTVLLPLFATIISGRRSLLTSSIATEDGSSPTAYVCCGWNVPSPLPSSTLTVPPPLLAATISARPSPLRSAAATEDGLNPGKRALRLEGPVTVAQ